MNAIELARKLAGLGESEEACRAYVLALQQDRSPEERLEAAAYILQSGGDYRISYTCFLELYKEGHFREDVFSLLTAAFYTPNENELQNRYEHNCKLLAKYPYLFRRDFLPFEELPIRFFPYDDHSYIPFDRAEERFGDFVDFKKPVVSRNFFRDLDKPVFAADVFSQYELEYLNDNVRKSENIGRENHIYLHYTDWGVFCSHLQCLNLRALLKDEKLVFLIGEEVKEYPIDFKARFGIDYSRYPLKPVGIREIHKMIWHTQLSSHNGGDFFNEVFDAHPNLLCRASLMMDSVEESVENVQKALDRCGSMNEAIKALKTWSDDPRVASELYLLRKRTYKDILVAYFLCSDLANCGLDPAARIAPALFFQPHFSNIYYEIQSDPKGNAVLDAPNYQQIRESPIFREFKYIKTFTPMRRFTASHGATVNFMYVNHLIQERRLEQASEEEKAREQRRRRVVSDVISQRILNRSFMIDPEDRLYKDSIAVRFEDGKLNPRATFTALAAFLDIPYCESMEVCSRGGEPVSYFAEEGYAPGFAPAKIYRTYDETVNDTERYFIEFFMRDAYEYYGYDFQAYDGAEVDEAKAARLIEGFTTMDKFIRETWAKVFQEIDLSQAGELPDGATPEEMRENMLTTHMKSISEKRLATAKILLRGLYFVNRHFQPLHMMRSLELDPALLEQPLYH